ncbi:MAG TPA: aerial mycelium formation protein [Mycobacteriales bacterium]|nr:aerial mycelium formation protein [Mycobacteriales bacterium]
MGAVSPGNRRIDRVLADDFLDGLADAPLAEVRRRRTEAEQEETDLSYLRRLLQGRIDILRTERERRAGPAPDESLVEALPRILADEGQRSAPHGLGRHVTVEPSRADMHRRYVEKLIADVNLSDPAAHDDDTLARVIGVLETEEAQVSGRRREVQQVMDACTAEITRRYRDGEANVADLLPTEADQ